MTQSMTMREDSKSGAPGYAAPAERTAEGAWTTLILLFLLFVLSFLDRSILALLAEPVAQSLALDDRQMALLLGLGFALVYAIGGVPLAQLVDTRSRRAVVSIGVAIWSVATVLTGFAQGFWSLLILRCGVALGESVLTPAAVSLIADLFPREKRGLPMAIYLSVGSFMSIGSYIVGAMALGVAEGVGKMVGLAPWQLTFVFVGVPGLVLAGGFAVLVKDPERGASQAIGRDDASLAVFADYLRSRWRVFTPLLSCAGLYSIFALSIVAWLPTVLVRGYGVTLAQAGYVFGMVGVPAGLAGTFFWPWLAHQIERRWPMRGAVAALFVSAIVCAPAFAGGIAAPTLPLLLTGVGLGVFAGTAFAVMPPLAFQVFGPRRMRARMAAVNLLVISVLGYGVGPLAAVELGDMIDAGPGALRLGLVALTLLSWPLVVLCTWFSLRHIQQAEVHD